MWQVAPLVGAWIEIFEACEKSKRHWVAPLVGAWIEIPDERENFYVLSRSSRGSVDWNIGYQTLTATKSFVAPLVGAWIEITIFLKLVSLGLRRSSRGSVDWNLLLKC